jgi:hypothetical protein
MEYIHFPDDFFAILHRCLCVFLAETNLVQPIQTCHLKANHMLGLR